MTATPNTPADLEALYGDAQNNPDLSDTLSNTDYVVEVVNPVDTVNTKTVTEANYGGYIPPAGTDNRLYRFTDENSINVFSGDTYAPQGGFTGPPGRRWRPTYLNVDHVVADPLRPQLAGHRSHRPVRRHAHIVPLNGSAEAIELDPDFDAGGGTPYAGRPMPICDSKLVTVVGGHSNPAGFYMYTDVPIPAKFYGLVNDDLNVQTDRRSIMLGEVAGLANGPVGIYDENGNWKYTAHSDPNGFYEVLLPSTGTYNCPLPAGPCAGVYRLVGNDPGTLAHRNTDYNPQFRTIATEFQAWPGVVHPVDQAPTHIGITIEGPAAAFGALSLCKLADNNPTLFAIDRPFYDPATDAAHPYIIMGTGFGTSGILRMDGTTIATTGWSNTQITFNGSAVSGLSQAPHQLSITNGQSGLATVNGLTFHRLSPGTTGNTTYLASMTSTRCQPATVNDNTGARIFTPQHDAWDAATDTPAGFSGTPKGGGSVSGGRAIQRAVEAARQSAGGGNNARAKLVVIYPNTAPNYAPHNPFAAYFENVVLHSKIMLQGVGPGGARRPDPLRVRLEHRCLAVLVGDAGRSSGRQPGHRRRQLLRRLAYLRARPCPAPVQAPAEHPRR